MNYKNLHLNVDFLGSSGVMLSPEEKASLQTSLIMVQHDENFSNILFWGKIIGLLSRDYFIVQGINETGGPLQMQDEGGFPMRRTLYSQDCVSWGLLNPATEEMKEKASFIRGRFTGDPSYEFELPLSLTKKQKLVEEEEVEEEDGDSEIAPEEANSVKLKEEDRLAAVVASIDEDAMIVPRGAYIKNTAGKIYRNRMFEGLSLQEATKLRYYFHFRKPIYLTRKTMLQRADLDSAIDFMDNIEEDMPNGCWSLQTDRGGGVVLLRNLYWLGYTFYDIPGTKEFGSVYFGTGEKNIDMPFML